MFRRTIYALAAIAALGFAAPAAAQKESAKTEAVNKKAPSSKQQAARNRMKDCGAEWRGMKKEGKSKGTTWRAFSKECLKRKAA